MMSVPRPTPDSNPYVTDLVQGLTAMGHRVEFFGMRSVLTRRFDILHIQWPEGLTEASTSPRRVVKLVLTGVLLARTAVSRTGVVRTVHNLAPHDGRSRAGSLIERAVDHLTIVRIYLNEADEARPPGSVVILHPRYRKTVTARRNPEPTGSVLAFGLLRPYKGYESLLDAWEAHPRKEHLRIVGGAAGDGSYAQALKARATRIRGAVVEPRFLPEAELQEAILRADLVALPYSGAYNSGAVLLALSLGVPVVTGDSPSMRALRAEVGSDWLHLTDGPMSTSDLDSALAVAARLRVTGTRPDLSRRDGADSIRLHSLIYQALAGSNNWCDLALGNGAREEFVRHSHLNLEMDGVL